MHLTSSTQGGKKFLLSLHILVHIVLKPRSTRDNRSKRLCQNFFFLSSFPFSLKVQILVLINITDYFLWTLQHLLQLPDVQLCSWTKPDSDSGAQCGFNNRWVELGHHYLWHSNFLIFQLMRVTRKPRNSTVAPVLFSIVTEWWIPEFCHHFHCLGGV